MILIFGMGSCFRGMKGVPYFSACTLVQKALVLMALLLGYFLLNLQVRFYIHFIPGDCRLRYELWENVT